MIILLYFFSFSGNSGSGIIVEWKHLIYFVKCESER